ncbi:hypothetical protein STIAU_1405, partial [Stigmatella aurantiaca DW4/3-1]
MTRGYVKSHRGLVG